MSSAINYKDTVKLWDISFSDLMLGFGEILSPNKDCLICNSYSFQKMLGVISRYLKRHLLTAPLFFFFSFNCATHFIKSCSEEAVHLLLMSLFAFNEDSC